MNVTINTDASFCPETKASGFAYWIVCNGQRIKGSAGLKDGQNSTDCEMKALANALVILERSPFNNGNLNTIYINSCLLYTSDAADE